MQGVQEKLQEKLQERAQLKAERAQEELEAFYAGLLAEARAGAERGHPLFSCTVTEHENSRSHAAFLGSVEALGWRLQHVDHVYVPNKSVSYGTTASDFTHSGVVHGYYLFRRL